VCRWWNGKKGRHVFKISGLFELTPFTFCDCRGLPHAHILLIVAPDDRPRGPEDYDKIVCAELPNKETHPELWDIVTRHMMHGPCGDLNRNCPCMEDGACTKNYPKHFHETTTDAPGAYPVYRRRDDGRFHEKIVNGE
jgi:hypothetical protein